jgi:hypothetical protein
VVHILPRDPKERFACLDLAIAHFRVEDVTFLEAIRLLCERLKAAGAVPGWVGHGPSYGHITLDLVNVTVRDALTHIVVGSKSGIGWSVGGYVQDPPAPGFSFGRFGGVLP